MSVWLVALILGFIEGLTEFIPVSSTGHLLIAEHWIPRQSDLYNIVIQCGAVLAVLPLFKDRLAMLARWQEPRSQQMIAKIATAFVITAGVGFVLDKKGFKLPDDLQPVALALIIVGAVFIAAETWLRGKKGEDEISWSVAIAVALAQLIAGVFPGTSRSGATIIAAMLVGASRVSATEFSFLVGIPTMLAAGGYKILKALSHSSHENWAALGFATVVAAIVSFIAVKWLLYYVRSHTLIGFGIYRIVAGGTLLLLLNGH
jgi:undecaprenyl-diphosphatase